MRAYANNLLRILYFLKRYGYKFSFCNCFVKGSGVISGRKIFHNNSYTVLLCHNLFPYFEDSDQKKF